MSKMKSNLTSKKVVLTSFFVDTLDIIFNGAIAFSTGSSIMLAEFLQGLADLVTVAFLYIGIKRSVKRADREHSFGYGRELYFWSLCSAIIMFAGTATLSFYFGYRKFANPEPISNYFLAYFILSIGIVSNIYALFLSIRQLKSSGEKSGIWKNFIASNLVEIKATFISDLMGSCAAFFGIIALIIYGITGNAQFDGLGAMFIGVTIAIFSIFLIKEIKDLIIGKSASPEIVRKIRQITEEIPGVSDIIDLRTMHFGSEKIQVNLSIRIKDELNTDEITSLIDNLETKIENSIPEIDDVQIEV